MYNLDVHSEEWNYSRVLSTNSVMDSWSEAERERRGERKWGKEKLDCFLRPPKTVVSFLKQHNKTTVKREPFQNNSHEKNRERKRQGERKDFFVWKYSNTRALGFVLIEWDTQFKYLVIQYFIKAPNYFTWQVSNIRRK